MSHLAKLLRIGLKDIIRPVDGFMFVFHRISDESLESTIGRVCKFKYPTAFASYLPNQNTSELIGKEIAFVAALVKADEWAKDLAAIQDICILHNRARAIRSYDAADLETIEEWCREVLEMTSWGNLGKAEAQTMLQAIQDWREWKAPSLSTSPTHGFVYLAYCSTGHYKIGYSKHPKARVKHFDTQMPVEVTIVHTIETDDAVELESYLHDHYRTKRQKGEWFSLEEQDIETLKAIPEWRYRDRFFVLNGRHEERRITRLELPKLPHKPSTQLSESLDTLKQKD